MLRAIAMTGMLAIAAVSLLPTASADDACTLGAGSVCVQQGPPGCHDFCGFVCVDNTCVVCYGDSSYPGTNEDCVVNRLISQVTVESG